MNDHYTLSRKIAEGISDITTMVSALNVISSLTLCVYALLKVKSTCVYKVGKNPDGDHPNEDFVFSEVYCQHSLSKGVSNCEWTFKTDMVGFFFRDGLRRRSQPDVLYKTPVAVVEVDKKKVTEEPVRSGGILSKFRKDSTGKKGRHLTSMACLSITIPFLCCIDKVFFSLLSVDCIS